MGKKLMILLLSAVLAWGLTACGSAGAQVEGNAPGGQAAADGKITITDVSGAQYTFDQPLKRVVVQWSCAGGPFMTMSALLGEEVWQYLAGIDDTPVINRADMWAQYTDAVPGLLEVPIIGSVEKEFNLEAVLASDAEAAIFPLELKAAASESIQPKLESAGIPVIYIDYHDETVENHVKSTEILGALFGKEERAREIIGFYREHISAVTDKVAEILKTRKRPEIYMEVGIGGPGDWGNTYNNSYMWGGIAYAAGAENIGEGVIENAAKIDPEYLLSANPEKIVFTGSYWPATPSSIRMGFEATEEKARELISAYLERPGWSELEAVKNGEVYALHHGLGREIYDCVCYEFLAKVCFPDEFTDLDPEASLREYYETFLPYEYTGVWFMEY